MILLVTLGSTVIGTMKYTEEIRIKKIILKH